MGEWGEELGEKEGVGGTVERDFLGPSITVNKDQSRVEDEEEISLDE